jgi:transposase InsO family protein
MEVVHPRFGDEAVVAGPEQLILEPRMKVHKNARMTVHGRLLLVARVRNHGWRVEDGAFAAGVSVRTAYKWLARHRAGGAPALHDRRSAPARSPRRLPADLVIEIERLRRQRLSGPQIGRRIQRPRSTVGLVLRRLGLGRLAALEPRPPVIRYQRASPGELLHLDTKKLGRIDGVGHRITGDRTGPRRHSGWEILHVAIDDAARLAYSEVLPDEKKASAIAFLDRALAWFGRHGVTVERVMTDNGSAYRSHAFRRACAGAGLRHLRTRPYTPRTNGKAERFIQTCLREWLYARTYTSSAQRNADMPAWLHHYNHHRPHAGIHALTPAARLNNLLGNDT